MLTKKKQSTSVLVGLSDTPNNNAFNLEVGKTMTNLTEIANQGTLTVPGGAENFSTLNLEEK